MSVRCSYCYEVGHNRRTCPHLKKALKKAAEDGNLYAKAELNKKIVRTCGYCARQGHDRRTCKYLKRDIERLASCNLEIRKRIQKKAQDLNFGVGTLVSAHFSCWNEEERAYRPKNAFGVIKKIDWEMVDIHSEWDSSGSSAWPSPVTVEFFDVPQSPTRRFDFPFEVSYLGPEARTSFPEWRMRDELLVHNAVAAQDEGESSLNQQSCQDLAKKLITYREWKESYCDRTIQRTQRYLGIEEVLTSQEQ